MNNTIQDFFKNLSPEEREKINEQERTIARKEHKKFQKALEQNKCYLCGNTINSFDDSKPCLHWLLWPVGIKKRNLRQYLEEGSIGYFRVDSFTRWMANSKKFIGNINNLLEESSKSKIFEHTVKYKNLEWSFSCSSNDYSGHKKGKRFIKPHYHLSINIGGKPVVSFSDFHIPFTKLDLFFLQSMDSGFLRHERIYDAGLQDVVDNIDSQKLLEIVKVTDNQKKAVWNIQTLLEAPKGKTISGDKIAELIKESKDTGVPFAQLVKKLGYKQRTIISPCEVTPNLFKRTKKSR